MFGMPYELIQSIVSDEKKTISKRNVINRAFTKNVDLIKR